MKCLNSHLTGAILVLLLTISASGQGQNPGRRSTDAPEPAQSDNRYLIEFRTWGPQARAAVNAAGGQVAHEFPALRAIAAYMAPQAAQALQNSPAVSFVEVDPRRYMMARAGPGNTGQTVPYGITMVQADQITSANPSNRKVCIIDSGYYSGHEDLQIANVTSSADSGTGNPLTDRNGHGTHIAGTIAALANSIGVIGVTGSGLLNLHVVKVFGDDGDWAYSSSLIAALDKCRQAGSNVVSMSLGGSIASRTENNAFASAYASGILSVAAAGNGGNTRKSYPASYESVISVAAIDSNKVVADFSQKNDAVELAAPGVAVLSTVPFQETNTVAAGGVIWPGTWIENAARTTTNGITAVLADGGLCTRANRAWSGQVVLCERGSNSLYEKVRNVQRAGGVAAIIYNNADGSFAGTLGARNSSTIPAVGIARADGLALKGSVGQNATVVSFVTNPASGYEAWNGTSMATPHVSGVAAVIWSVNPGWTNVEIRQALRSTAQDLGAAGRDIAYGFGLVQGKAALDRLTGSIGARDSAQPVLSSSLVEAEQQGR